MRRILIFFLLSLTVDAAVLERRSSGDRNNDVTLAQKLKEISLEIRQKGHRYFGNERAKLDTYNVLKKSVYVLGKETSPLLIEAVTLLAGEMTFLDRSPRAAQALVPLWKRESQKILMFSQKLEPRKQLELKRQLRIALKR